MSLYVSIWITTEILGWMSSNFSKNLHLSKRLHQQHIYYHSLKISSFIRDQRDRCITKEANCRQKKYPMNSLQNLQLISQNCLLITFEKIYWEKKRIETILVQTKRELHKHWKTEPILLGSNTRTVISKLQCTDVTIQVVKRFYFIGHTMHSSSTMENIDTQPYICSLSKSE